MAHPSLSRYLLLVVIAGLLGHLLVGIVNSHDAAWIWTQERGQPLSEALLKFWTVRVPYTLSVGLVAIGLCIAVVPLLNFGWVAEGLAGYPRR